MTNDAEHVLAEAPPSVFGRPTNHVVVTLTCETCRSTFSYKCYPHREKSGIGRKRRFCSIPCRRPRATPQQEHERDRSVTIETGIRSGREAFGVWRLAVALSAAARAWGVRWRTPSVHARASLTKSAARPSGPAWRPSRFGDEFRREAAINGWLATEPSYEDYSNRRLDLMRGVARLTATERNVLARWACNEPGVDAALAEAIADRVRIFAETGVLPPSPLREEACSDANACAHLRIILVEPAERVTWPLFSSPRADPWRVCRDCHAYFDDASDTWLLPLATAEHAP